MKLQLTGRTEFLIFLTATGLLLAPMVLQLGSVPFHPSADYSDLLISHWPNAHFLGTEIASRGEIPLWNPLILSGAPLIADPLFSVWYPPSWLTLVLPPTVAFNLLFILHISWAGFGVYQLLRKEGASRAGALLAGIAFGGMPKLIGHVTLGHIGLVSAVAWTPWLLLAIREWLEHTFDEDRLHYQCAAISGGMIALTFLADPRWLIPASAITLFYAGYLIWQNSWTSKLTKKPFPLALSIFCLAALGVSSGLSLPLTEFLTNSTRAGIEPEVASEISLPLNNLIKLLVPDLGGWPETLPFVGILVLGLAVSAIFSRSKGWAFWFFISLGSLLLALGDQTPIYGLLVRIVPGLKFTRVPARFLFLCGLGLTVLAGLGLDSILKVDMKRLPALRLIAFGFAAVAILIGLALFILEDDTSAIGVFLISTAVVFLLLFFVSIRESTLLNAMPGLWIIAILIELMVFRGTIMKMVSGEDAFNEKGTLLEMVSDEANGGRILSTSYSIPQHLAAREGLQSADGINPLQLQVYETYMTNALGYSGGDYSVTLPPFPDGNPSTPQSWKIDAGKLGQLNVTLITSEYPIENEHLSLVEKLGTTYIYHNELWRPRAWVEPTGSDGNDWSEVNGLDWSPNEIVVTADGPGRLVLSEVAFPGWVVTVDDKPGTIEQHSGVFRSVKLEPGEHTVRFSYRPMRVYLGATMTLISVIATAWAWLKR